MPVIRRVSVMLATLLTILFALPASAAKPVLVRLQTSAGPITFQLEMQRAPITAGKFLRYVDEKRFDGTFFYRAARNKRTPTTGLVQGRINHRVVRARLPIAHEPTSRTGLAHVDGTDSMARNAPATAMGDFFITVGSAPYLNARPGSVGYAAFGKVVSGMPIVRKMLAEPTYPGGWTATTKGQQIIAPIRIVSARRVQ
jgi:peptidyl-prolyl cis-trans isomerase A (cyclophilin A)